jgi:CRP-like cAMP-binding protein
MDYINKYDLNQYFSKDMTEYMTLKVIPKGSYIFQAGDIINEFLFFVHGKAKVINTQPNGKNLLVAFYKPLKSMGDLELFREPEETFDVLAIEECHVISIERSTIESMCQDDPVFLKYLHREAVSKLKEFQQISITNLLYPLENRLANYLLETSVTRPSDNHVKYVFNEQLTEVSELLGTSYRHLLRAMKSFTDSNIIKKVEKHYELINIDVLEDLSKELY